MGRRRHRYYEPLGIPSDTTPFHRRLISAANARCGRPGRVSPVRVELSTPALLRTPDESCIPPVSMDAVCCLRRDMIGSASPPFRPLISRGCKVHAFALGLRRCSPPSPEGPRVLDAPLRRADFAARPEPATRRTGAYRGGTYTRKFDTACRTYVPPPAAAFVAVDFKTHHARILSPQFDVGGPLIGTPGGHGDARRRSPIVGRSGGRRRRRRSVNAPREALRSDLSAAEKSRRCDRSTGAR